MNKTVFITGGQSSTGYGIADFFARQGWDVIISAQKGDEARAAAKKLSEQYGISALGYELDLCQEPQMIEIFNDLDQKGIFVETLVLNANHPLVKFILNEKDSESTPVICRQLYDLAVLSHKPLTQDEMAAFVKRSNEIMMLLTK